jgi:hypothetical protein
MNSFCEISAGERRGKRDQVLGSEHQSTLPGLRETRTQVRPPQTGVGIWAHKPRHPHNPRNVDIRLPEKGAFKFPWREAALPNHLDDEVDSDHDVDHT